jgi:hypothetical protein
MKYTLLAITAVALIFAACRKNPERQNCYACVYNDSLVSAIPYYNQPHFYQRNGNHCKFTDDMKNLHIRQNTYVDTYFIGKTGDSLIMRYHTVACELY